MAKSQQSPMKYTFSTLLKGYVIFLI